MALNPTSPLAGSAATDWTSPSFTFVQDVAPEQNGKQIAITVIGGAPSAQDAHSVAKPFTLNFVRPKAFRTLPTNAVPGSSVPRNTYKLITRKGVKCDSGGLIMPVMNVVTELAVPAGAEYYNKEAVKSAVIAHIGFLSANSAAIADACVTGLM